MNNYKIYIGLNIIIKYRMESICDDCLMEILKHEINVDKNYFFHFTKMRNIINLRLVCKKWNQKINIFLEKNYNEEKKLLEQNDFYYYDNLKGLPIGNLKKNIIKDSLIEETRTEFTVILLFSIDVNFIMLKEFSDIFFKENNINKQIFQIFDEISNLRYYQTNIINFKLYKKAKLSYKHNIKATCIPLSLIFSHINFILEKFSENPSLIQSNKISKENKQLKLNQESIKLDNSLIIIQPIYFPYEYHCSECNINYYYLKKNNYICTICRTDLDYLEP